MPRIHWTGGRLWVKLRCYAERKIDYLALVYHTLCFNSFTNWNVVVDTLLEPLFWIVDKLAKYLGPVMVIMVVVLTTSVVVIFYTCLLPHLYTTRSMATTIFMFISGHWLLFNIVFHYYMAALTDPGTPQQDIKEVVSICKKCISPKPPRTHHCSICNVCVLKMDHHCPWLNNCVGHYNHRHFFLFMAFMWMGTVFVCTNAYQLFSAHFDSLKEGPLIVTSLIVPIYTNIIKSYKYQFAVALLFDVDCEICPGVRCLETCWANGTNKYEAQLAYRTYEHPDGMWYHHAVLYEFLLCAGVVVALGLLMLWHARLITRAETSIEIHINNKERKRLKEKGIKFKNPYNLGALKNWQVFLGFDSIRSFFWFVFLPSGHRPEGDGLRWRTSTYQLPIDLI